MESRLSEPTSSILSLCSASPRDPDNSLKCGMRKKVSIAEQEGTCPTCKRRMSEGFSSMRGQEAPCDLCGQMFDPRDRIIMYALSVSLLLLMQNFVFFTARRLSKKGTGNRQEL